MLVHLLQRQKLLSCRWMNANCSINALLGHKEGGLRRLLLSRVGGTTAKAPLYLVSCQLPVELSLLTNPCYRYFSNRAGYQLGITLRNLRRVTQLTMGCLEGKFNNKLSTFSSLRETLYLPSMSFYYNFVTN